MGGDYTQITRPVLHDVADRWEGDAVNTWVETHREGGGNFQWKITIEKCGGGGGYDQITR